MQRTTVLWSDKDAGMEHSFTICVLQAAQRFRQKMRKEPTHVWVHESIAPPGLKTTAEINIVPCREVLPHNYLVGAQQ